MKGQNEFFSRVIEDTVELVYNSHPSKEEHAEVEGRVEDIEEEVGVLKYDVDRIKKKR